MDGLGLEHWGAGLGAGLVDLQQHLAPHHHPGQIELIDVRGVHRADDLAPAQHRHPVRQRHDLPQLVRDQDDGEALVSHGAKGAEQLLHALGGQDCGGLVQNENLDAEVERLEDLHPLLLAHREPPHLGVGIDLHVVAREELLETAPGLSQVEPLLGRGADDHVLDDRQRRHQLEVLVNHADSGLDGVAG